MIKVSNLEIIRVGSAKNIRRVDKNSLAFECTDDVSMFDVGKAPFIIPGKGKAICASAVRSFLIAEAIGVPTHYIGQLDERTIRVMEMQIITGRPLTLQDVMYVLPAEWIYRLAVAGGLLRAFRDGTKNPLDYGLPAGIPTEGTPLPWPVEMFTTKFEEEDRELTTEEALALAGITAQDAREYWSMIHRLTGAIAIELQKVGYRSLDGKLEVLMGKGRQKMIGDVCGTSDEDRPVLLSALKEGRVEHHSKEFLRQVLIEMGYHADLKKARANGKKDLPIPQLSEEIIAEASRRYTVFAEAYSGLSLTA